MKWARIEDGVVLEIISEDPAGRYHPSIIWVPCGDEVEPGWTDSFVPPSLELSAWKQRTVNEILAAFAVEVRKPVTIGDLRFDGGWTSLDKMDRAIQFADRLRITERTFYETDETPHVLPIHGEGLTGDSILIAIAMAYDTLDGTMRAMVKQVNDAETIETFSISWE